MFKVYIENIFRDTRLENLDKQNHLEVLTVQFDVQINIQNSQQSYGKLIHHHLHPTYIMLNSTLCPLRKPLLSFMDTRQMTQ